MITVDPAVIVLATLAASLVLFLTDAMRYELIALLVVLALAVTQCLTPQDAFAGFASPAVVLIGSMYIFGHAVSRWGLAELIGQKLLMRGSNNEALLAFRVCLVSGLFSSFLSNTGVVAALIPVLSGVSRKSGVPVSRLLMPLAFGSLLGGTITLLGTSHNLVVNEALRAHGAQLISLFDFAPLGLILLGVGSLYFLGPGRALLPKKRGERTLSERYQVRKFVTEVLVEPSSTLINRTVAETNLFTKYGINVVGIVRPDASDLTLAPGPYNRIRGDDTLILQGEPDAILRLRTELGLRQVESIEKGHARLSSADVSLVEGVIPAGSTYIGHTLRESDFRARTGLNVLALSKHGEVQLERMTRTALEMGDTLLIQGHQRDIERARRERELLILDEVQVRPIGQGALITIGMLTGVILLTALTDVNLSVAALLGAVGLVLLGAVRPTEATRSIDWPVILLVGGMLSLGKAFENYGLADGLAGWISHLGSVSRDPTVVIAMLFGATVLLTQILNNVSTAVIMTPVALSLADQMGMGDRPFVMSVLIGSSMAFLSPIAHQANAMIVGPGDYRYRDFLKVGFLLAVVMTILCSLLIPFFWPITPLG